MLKEFFIIGFIMWSAYLSEAQEIVTTASSIQFEVKSSGGLATTEGSIAGPEGEVKFDPSDLKNSYFHVRVDVSTINTGVNMRDNHLKSDDFFHIETFPYITFRSHSITKTADGYLTIGTLKIKDVGQPVEIPFQVKSMNNQMELIGEFSINRKNFDIGTSFGRFFIGNDVQIKIKTVLTYQ